MENNNMKSMTKVRGQSRTITSDKMFLLLVVVMLCHNTVFNYFAIIISKLPFISVFRPFFFPFLYTTLTVLSLKDARFKWLRASDIGIILFVTMSILMTILIYPQNVEHISSALWEDILPCLPFFLLGLCITLDEKLYKAMGDVSCIAIVINSLYKIYFFSSGRTLVGSHGEDYSMHSSYLLLTNTLFAIDYAFKTKKVLPIICSIIGIIYAFAMGTRGPVVIIAVFICVCMWRNIKYSGKKSGFVVIALIALLIFSLSPLYEQILVSFYDILEESGASTRVVDYLLNEEMISETSGRDDIYIELLDLLGERPLLGYGVYGEYPVGHIAGAHNIYLQVVFHFGYPLGIALLLGYIFVFIDAVIKSKGTLYQNWILLIGTQVFVRGIFGGEYLNYMVFLLLGICLRVVREKNKFNILT